MKLLTTTLSILTFVYCSLGYGQKQGSPENPIKIKLDFEKKTFSGTDFRQKFRTGAFYQIEIDSINMNLYNVTISKEDSTITSSVTFPTFDLLGTDAINTAIANITSSIAAVKNYKQQGDSLEMLKKPENDLLEKIDSTNSRLEEVMSDAKTKVEAIEVWLADLQLRSLSYLQSLTSTPSSPLAGTNEKFQEMIQNAQRMRNQIDIALKRIDSLATTYKKLKSDSRYKTAFEKEEIKKFDENITKNLADSKTSLETEKEKISPSKIVDYVASIIQLENNKTRTFLSLPFRQNQDVNKLTLSITPKNAEYGQSYTAQYTFPATKFYVGLGAGFYGAGFRNDVYSTRENTVNDTTSNFSIVNENVKKGEIGFNVLLHVGGKIYEDWLGLHGSVGPALSLDSKTQARFSLGGGISIGKNKNMATIDALWMIGNVQRLSQTYDADPNKTYSEKPDQVTISKLASSIGFSIGYIYQF